MMVPVLIRALQNSGGGEFIFCPFLNGWLLANWELGYRAAMGDYRAGLNTASVSWSLRKPGSISLAEGGLFRIAL